jgi:hypothetical protein
MALILAARHSDSGSEIVVLIEGGPVLAFTSGEV